MKRPADCLDEARYLMGDRPDADPTRLAQAEQYEAQAKEMLAALRSERHMPFTGHLPDTPEVWAFKIAAGEAFFERMQEPRGVMCEHLTDLTIPHVVDLAGSFASCELCLPIMPAIPWSKDQCDVCGTVVPSLRFTPMAFNLGAAAAFANLCAECIAFLGPLPEQS